MRRKVSRPKTKRRRNLSLVYFIPSLLTISNLYFGFISINYSIKGKFDLAALFIIFAAIMDFLDGRVARALKTSSPMGREMDSLSDIVSFGLAPSLLIYLWGLKFLPRLGILVAFVYLVGGALRLARFNILAANGVSAKRYFEGLPIPSASMVLVGIVLFFKTPPYSPFFIPILAGIVFSLAFLMVSKIKYRSFKDLNVKTKEHYLTIFLFSILLASVAAWPRTMIFFLTTMYVSSGPIHAFYRLIRKTVQFEESESEGKA